jgi:hypothetical protein
MSFSFAYPVYAFVESSAKDPAGTTTFTNPLAITCTANLENKPPVSLDVIPIFTQDGGAIAFHRGIKSAHKTRLRITAHEQLIDFLTKVSSRAKHVAIDPTPTQLTSDRIWPIDNVLATLRDLVAKRQPR